MAPPAPIVIDAQAVSGITGSISIACWIIVFAPQIYENFIRKSSEGLSLLFVVLWLLGDVFNVLGAVLQGVLPTMTILAIYYTLADIVLLWQCLAYGDGKHGKVDPIHLSPANPLSEHDNLLEAAVSNEENYSSDGDEIESFIDTNGMEDTVTSNWRPLFFNIVTVALVFIAGIGGWYISSGKKGVHKHKPEQPDDELIFDNLAQTFGWLCAALYLGSRIPQILLNFERKSCEGISFLFFLFACLGNMTYVVSILSVSTGKNYLLVNASWLAGSLGTLLLDFVIFVQFFIYNDPEKGEPLLEDGLEESGSYGAV
ncbi:unnamed protein product [Kuraishia capsulata CBS 1993]|uniref:Uncharacterized protein n=1 Tax=Kuraishia capsulata CBS 1993 TaxID=1382522 RepID=W6MFA2_9ASCO|nr:uncharacterized protein KUCA_T00000376001 [Kuraishia capsulata CBS 1993]CDK24414.1 unnamed protein product [Kuraishia capsulata CBS 1993]